MKSSIPLNFFVFLWALMGVVILGHSYVVDIRSEAAININRYYVISVLLFMFCLLYCVLYVRDKIMARNRSASLN